MGSTGKRMYCPKCNKNRTWNSAFKKQQMEPGEKPYDFRFYVCKTCEYAYDPKTSLEIPDWRARYYSAENFEAVVIDRRKPKGIIDKILMKQDMMMRAQMQELDFAIRYRCSLRNHFRRPSRRYYDECLDEDGINACGF